MNAKQLTVSLCFAVAFGAAEAATLKEAFRNPPEDTRPGCYWYWINDNVSKNGITKDLEAMARVGIGRAYIGHIFNREKPTDTPVGKVPFMSDAWWEAMQWAVTEANRCGVEIGFFNSPGWSQSGGPWIKPSQSMRYLAGSETMITGGRRVEQQLPVPEIKTFPKSGGLQQTPTGPPFTAEDFLDVRVLAFRQPEPEADDLDMGRVKASSPGIKSLVNLLDGSAKTSVKIGREAQVIEFLLDDPVPVQSLRIDPRDRLYTLTCVVACSDDGNSFRELAQHVEERGHQGPRNKDPILIPFPETRAKRFRVTLSASGPVSFSGIALSRRAVLAHYVRKQLGETSPSVRPPWNAYVWDRQPNLAAGTVVDSAQVIDLSDKMDADGRLCWDAPRGRWVVMRVGMVPIGTQCAPSSPESRGLEVDKMNRDHVRSLFDGMVGEFLRRTPAVERKALKYVIADSYETGPQNWTEGLVTKFEQSKAFIDYTRRSSVLLKTGLPVIDVAYYIGENAPAMQGPRNPELPDGYDFDYINSDVLIHRAYVKDGRITVKDGPGYAVLVLPKQSEMRPEVVEAIKRLVRDGATVVGPKPRSSPSLADYPACDETVARIAGEVWGSVEGNTVKMQKFGKGCVYDGVELEDLLVDKGLEPDVRVINDGTLLCAAAGAGKIGIGNRGGIVYKHRSGTNIDVYFLANTSDIAVDFTASLRVAGRQPLLWNAVTGEISKAAAFAQKDGRTLIPLHLEASESIYVVFKGTIDLDARGPATSNATEYTVVAALDGNWTVRFDGQGAPEKIMFDTLLDWSNHANDAIRYYAGTAVYEKSFALAKPTAGKPIILELGDVGVIATVFANGKKAGTVWTTPWEIDITGFLVAGKNDLQIRVANTWNNRLIADAARPKDERRSYVSQAHRFDANAPLHKGGLLGPVRIRKQR